jgi:hypothetical protein
MVLLFVLVTKNEQFMTKNVRYVSSVAKCYHPLTFQNPNWTEDELGVDLCVENHSVRYRPFYLDWYNEYTTQSDVRTTGRTVRRMTRWSSMTGTSRFRLRKLEIHF